MSDVQGKGFADYEPTARPAKKPTSPVQVHRLTATDVTACAALIASRGGGDPDVSADKLRRDLAHPDRHLFVAASGEDIVGYGAVIRHEPTPVDPPDTAPAGYYLVGLMIASHWRRRGIGELLTTSRMTWVRQHTDEVWCFANIANAAVLDLQRRLGFAEVTRQFSFPGAPLAPGTAVLLRAPLR
ncbi:MAG: N-acetyltransferase [Pseudonocardiales bacterium]|nr:MAG: N-acetyltransferase [Pseudonocardiales bacterium]